MCLLSIAPAQFGKICLILCSPGEDDKTGPNLLQIDAIICLIILEISLCDTRKPNASDLNDSPVTRYLKQKNTKIV